MAASCKHVSNTRLSHACNCCEYIKEHRFEIKLSQALISQLLGTGVNGSKK